MTARRRHRSTLARSGAAALLAVALVPAAAGRAGAAPTGNAPEFTDNGATLSLRVPSGAGAPGYTIVVATSPFRITTQRAGGTVLQT
ncbi:MAG TPA: hypothetical protein VF869_06915, partial [Jatrophihabitantaceae bacterium]